MTVLIVQLVKSLQIYQLAHHPGISHSSNYVFYRCGKLQFNPRLRIYLVTTLREGWAGCRDVQAGRMVPTRGQCDSKWSLT